MLCSTGSDLNGFEDSDVHRYRALRPNWVGSIKSCFLPTAHRGQLWNFKTCPTSRWLFFCIQSFLRHISSCLAHLIYTSVSSLCALVLSVFKYSNLPKMLPPCSLSKMETRGFWKEEKVSLIPPDSLFSSSQFPIHGRLALTRTHMQTHIAFCIVPRTSLCAGILCGRICSYGEAFWRGRWWCILHNFHHQGFTSTDIFFFLPYIELALCNGLPF